MKKNILILINQNEINNAFEIASRLKLEFKLIFFITDVHSSYDYLRSIYKSIKNKFPESQIFDYFDEFKSLNNRENEKKVDFKFLKKFESNLYSKSIIQNFLKDICLNNLYGYRDITYHPKNKKVYYKLIYIISKKIHFIFLNNKIKFIYSPNTINFSRNLIKEICIKKKIPFYWISFRISDYLFLTNLADITNFKIIKKNIQKINDSKIRLIKKKLIYNSNISEYKNKIITFAEFTKKIFKFLFYYFKTFKNDYINYKKRVIFKHKQNYFDSITTLKTYYYWFKRLINVYSVQKYLLVDHSQKLNFIKKNNYIFYPLHVTPEAGVYDQSELYDQLFLIQKIAKKLPIDIFLIIKAHPSNFSEYNDIENLEWYKSINKIYNVVLLSHHVNSLYLIKRSLAVISVNGTACLEANLMGKPSFLIGGSEFSGLYGIYKFADNFLKNIKNFNKKKTNKNNFYFNYILNNSLKMDNYKYFDFLHPSNEFIKKKCKPAFDFFAKKILILNK
jgi:hypothetical protein